MTEHTAESAAPTIRFEDGVPWVGDRSFAWASGVDHNDWREFRERRFRLTFENGWTLSVVWGSGSYSSNHDAYFGQREFFEEATTAEIALWDRWERWVKWAESGDTVRGYCTAEVVLQAVDFAAALPSEGFDFDQPAALHSDGSGA